MNRATQPIPVGPLKTGKPKLARTRVRRTPGTMNKTEAAYAMHLAARQMGLCNGGVAAFWFEGITLKIGHDTRYTPDFLVQMADGSLECHDTKGWDTEPAAAVKERVSSTMFPLFVFKEVRYEGGKLSGRWVEKVIGPKDLTP